MNVYESSTKVLSLTPSQLWFEELYIIKILYGFITIDNLNFITVRTKTFFKLSDYMFIGNVYKKNYNAPNVPCIVTTIYVNICFFF